VTPVVQMLIIFAAFCVGVAIYGCLTDRAAKKRNDNR